MFGFLDLQEQQAKLEYFDYIFTNFLSEVETEGYIYSTTRSVVQDEIADYLGLTQSLTDLANKELDKAKHWNPIIVVIALHNAQTIVNMFKKLKTTDQKISKILEKI